MDRTRPHRSLAPDDSAGSAVTDRVWTIGLAVALTALVGVLYMRILHAPFIFDDRPAIIANPSIRRLWPLYGDAETRGPLNPPGLAPTARRPFANLTLALNHRFGGDDPAGYRAVNVALHVLCALLLASIVRQTLSLPSWGGAWRQAARPLSALAALLWAVHPLTTEAVAYVTQRTELLGAFFYLLTLEAAIRYWTAGGVAARRAWLAVGALAMLAGVASKETVVSAPLVVWLYERTFVAGSPRATRRSWPLYAALLPSVLLLVLLSAFGVPGLSDARHRIPAPVWWMTQAKVLWLYAQLAVWPRPLSIHYAPAYLRTVGAAWPWLAATVIATGVIVVLTWRRPPVRFVLTAVVLVLAPTLVVPLPKMMVAERRMYLPLAGLVVLAVVGGYRSLRGRRTLLFGGAMAASALLTAYAALSAQRLMAYETAVAIWDDAVRHQPDDAMAHYNLGVALLEERDAPDAAMREFQEALRLDPEHTGALDNLGMVLNRLGRPEEARGLFERALRVEPADVVAHNDLATSLMSLGRVSEAIPHLQQALALPSDEPKELVHRNLGKALLDVGRLDDGLAQLEEAVQSQPDSPEVLADVGAAWLGVGQPAAALPYLEKAIRLRPNDAETLNNLGTVSLQRDDAHRAVEYYERALALRPDYASAHNNLGSALVRLGRLPEAIAHFERAIGLRPDYVNARYNLGSALLDSGRAGEAIPYLQEAARANPRDPHIGFRLAVAMANGDQPEHANTVAESALATARAQGAGPLAEEIGAWLRARSPVTAR